MTTKFSAETAIQSPDEVSRFTRILPQVNEVTLNKWNKNIQFGMNFRFLRPWPRILSWWTKRCSMDFHQLCYHRYLERVPNWTQTKHSVLQKTKHRGCMSIFTRLVIVNTGHGWLNLVCTKFSVEYFIHFVIVIILWVFHAVSNLCKWNIK